MGKVQDFLQKNKQLFLAHLYSLGLPLIGFIICRYTAFGIHSMKAAQERVPAPLVF